MKENATDQALGFGGAGLAFLETLFLTADFFEVAFLALTLGSAAPTSGFGVAAAVCFACLILAQRFFIAAAILARPAADIFVRTFAPGATAAGILFAARQPMGRPGLLFTAPPESVSDKSALACRSLESSASISERMLTIDIFVFTSP